MTCPRPRTHATRMNTHTPEVLYTDEAEHHDLLRAALIVVKGPVAGMIERRIVGWTSWPHYVVLPLESKLREAFRILTKNTDDVVWLHQHTERLNGLIQACVTSVVQYTRLTGGELKTDAIARCVKDQINTMLTNEATKIFHHNSILVEPVLPFAHGMRLRYTWPQVFDTRQAFAMAQHRRLGKGSFAGCLSEDLVRLILDMALFGTTRLDTRDRPPSLRRRAIDIMGSDVHAIGDSLWQIQLAG